MARIKEPRTCIICGAEFMPKSPTQKLCGNIECRRENHRRYVKKHAEMYRILNREYRKKEENRIYRAEYDKEYQKKHKAKIRAYKQAYWKRKIFEQKLQQGILLENTYWFSLSRTDQNMYREQLEQILESK